MIDIDAPQEIPAMTTHVADPYSILGVATEASDDDLDHAFRGLVRQLHPDTRPSRTSATSAESDDDADQRLQEILNAYATLRDPVRRAVFDRTRARPATAAKAPAPRPADPDTLALDTLTPDTLQGPTLTRVGPAIRVGPVHLEPPQATTDAASSMAGHAR